MKAAATIRAQDLSLVLGSVKLRRYTDGRTCRLCALSEAPVIQLACRDRYSSREEAAKYGVMQCRVSPIQRGDIAVIGHDQIGDLWCGELGGKFGETADVTE